MWHNLHHTKGDLWLRSMVGKFLILCVVLIAYYLIFVLEQWSYNHSSSTIISFMVATFTMVLNSIFYYCMVYVVDYEKRKSKTDYAVDFIFGLACI